MNKIQYRSNKELITAMDTLKELCSDDRGSVASLVVLMELLVKDEELRTVLLKLAVEELF